MSRIREYKLFNMSYYEYIIRERIRNDYIIDNVTSMYILLFNIYLHYSIFFVCEESSFD